jgi:5-methylcytosine-specific restriction enzyme subunit McrC
MTRQQIRQLSLREYQTTPAVQLSREERDSLQAFAPSVTVTPTRGTDDLFDLTPSSWIGAVELPTVSIEIRPKVPLDRVFFLLSYAIDPRTWRQSTFSFAAAPTLLEAMIPPFATAVAQALRRGVLQGYRIEEDALQTVRGRIRFDEQIKRRYGRIPPIELQFDEFTEDIPPNRLIKTALARLSRLRIRNDEARRTLRRFDHALERVRTVEYDLRQLPEITYTRLNAHYRPAVELAKLVIRATSLELEHGAARGAAFLVDMNSVFENFVVVALREALRLGPTTFPQGAARHRLFLDRGRRVRLRPDISWWDGGTCLFVGDVKYKRVQVAQIEHADVYQLLAYTIATGLPGGLLIYAADEATPVEHEVPLAGKRLRVTTLDVRGDPDTILARAKRLAAQIRQLRTEAVQSEQAKAAYEIR